MDRRFCVIYLAAFSVLGATWHWASPFSAAEEKNKSPAKSEAAGQPGGKKAALKAFMRKKLDASQKILEGLAVEDFELIAQGAKQLKATSAAAEFVVHDDPLYAQHADDFRRIAIRLEKAAKESRLDGAALQYVDMTMSCIECHKFVRTTLLAQ
ncbi:MAG TPA: hypothetical protein VL475_04165 [Planctomycetaceae bacterium]|jgi:hypothetical protein|nr:hypothetical protein [Planctomycetaceae bacterium]